MCLCLVPGIAVDPFQYFVIIRSSVCPAFLMCRVGRSGEGRQCWSSLGTNMAMPVTQDIGDLALGQVFLLALQFYQEPG